MVCTLDIFINLSMLIASIAFFLISFRLLYSIKYFKHLHDVEHISDQDYKWPKVSLVIPVCNEIHTLEKAAKSLFLMNYSNIEFIFVNDRSNDGTAKLLSRLSEQEIRMKVITVQVLPSGWLGKVNAFNQGISAASGEWILFSDADVVYHRNSLKKAISYVEDKKLDFLSVIPSVQSKSYFSRVLLAQILQLFMLSVNLRNISKENSHSCIAHGAFMLTRRTAYERSRGFEWLKMEVLDDMALANEMKCSGAKVGVLFGINEIEFEWYNSLKEVICGFEKNSFSALQYSMFFALAYESVAIWFFTAYAVFPFFASIALYHIILLLSICSYLWSSAYTIQFYIKVPKYFVLFFPLTMLFMPLIIARSALITWINKGIKWRGTFYPLSKLKAGQRLKILKFNRNSD